jgi:hypothetical protein
VLLSLSPTMRRPGTGNFVHRPELPCADLLVRMDSTEVARPATSPMGSRSMAAVVPGAMPAGRPASKSSELRADAQAVIGPPGVYVMAACPHEWTVRLLWSWFHRPSASCLLVPSPPSLTPAIHRLPPGSRQRNPRPRAPSKLDNDVAQLLGNFHDRGWLPR